jgi:hypothetical protein
VLSLTNINPIGKMHPSWGGFELHAPLEHDLASMPKNIGKKQIVDLYSTDENAYVW